MKSREPRIRVILPARMRWDGRWVSGSVRNVSSRGLMVCSSEIPPLGTYVELVVGSETITARTVWSDQQAWGVRSRSAIDFARLREASTTAGCASASAEFGSVARHDVAHPARRRSAELNRHLSHAFQYVTALIVGSLVAGSIGWEVYRTLSAPLLRIAATMAGAR
jgi:hypothetical protein